LQGKEGHVKDCLVWPFYIVNLKQVLVWTLEYWHQRADERHGNRPPR